MAIGAMGPLLWGLATNHVNDSIWMTLTAEAICWIELKGTFNWRVSVLAGGTLLAVAFAILGTITGGSIWLSVGCMLGVAFISALFKNLGDRGSSLAICVYLLFIFCNAYPAHTYDAIRHRSILVLIGAGWTLLISLGISLFTPVAQPYRRHIGIIWRAIANLVCTINKGWDGNETRSSLQGIYQSEKEVRMAIDSSYAFYGDMAHQLKKEHTDYQLAQLRKAASIAAVNITNISDELEGINIKSLTSTQRAKLTSLLQLLQQGIERIAVYSVNRQSEELILIRSSINQLTKLCILIKEQAQKEHEMYRPLMRIVQSAERTTRLLETSIDKLTTLNTDRTVERSYSFTRTLFVLHPKHIINNLKTLFNFNTFTTRFALRLSAAAAMAMFLYKWFGINHGYWLPFSVIIVMQPYFGATLKKARERVAGTLLGGLTGSVILRFPAGLHLTEIMLFLTFILMVYYLRRQYAVAAFAITLNLVLLFNIEATLNSMLIITRALCTIGGAGLAVAAGFALLPVWDRKLLPNYLHTAIKCNYCYFLKTFYSQGSDVQWTRNKRIAETQNSNLFDSFNRYMQEPTRHKNATAYYDVITHNIRITRNLNNINLELEQLLPTGNNAPETQQALLAECLLWFHKILEDTKVNMQHNTPPQSPVIIPFELTTIQILYVEKILLELKSIHATTHPA